MTACKLDPGRRHAFDTACQCAMPAVAIEPDPMPAWLAGVDWQAEDARQSRRLIWLLVLLLAFLAARPLARRLRTRRVSLRPLSRVLYALASVGPCWHDVHPRREAVSLNPP